ncbi:hypothetical protein K2Y11_17335 [bacterium]|nr:hypothetical protein [bacterium]
MDLLIRLIFIGSGLTLALMNARELFIAWYSGPDPEVSPFRKVMLSAECILLLVTTTFVSIITLRD